MVLAQKVAVLPADQREARGHAPVLPDRLRVLRLQVDAAAVLADHGFEHETTVGVEGVPGARHEGPRRAAHGRVRYRRAVCRDYLSGIAADERPLAGLPFQLHYIKRILVRL